MCTMNIVDHEKSDLYRILVFAKSRSTLSTLAYTVIEVSFDPVAMSLVGPLLKFTTGTRTYILVVLDCAIRYPKAIPLKNMSSEVT